MEKIFMPPSDDTVLLVLESRVDKGLGPCASVIVRCGILKVGDTVVAGERLCSPPIDLSVLPCKDLVPRTPCPVCNSFLVVLHVYPVAFLLNHCTKGFMRCVFDMQECIHIFVLFTYACECEVCGGVSMLVNACFGIHMGARVL